jgi:hypothetical protein
MLLKLYNHMIRTKVTQKFRIWYRTPYGVGIDQQRGASADTLKLSKKQRLNLIEIEQLEENSDTNRQYGVVTL